ncbi:gas1-like protein [Apiospora rasikravindrae]|uniref:Gas1-like protein n=1 Tax=Apiospora rasikravindrae TaxID=990691 RepID=A0ABR1RQV0_9PEZI
MSSFKILSLAALVAVAQAHSQLLKIQGKAGSPASVGLGVDPNIARNCTTINPCQQDSTIIRDAEIKQNIVNECGRNEIIGNIDIGENTENAIAAGAVTEAGPGEKLTVTLHQVNADGAGPYACDLIEQGNTGIITQNLTVQNNVPGANGFSQEKFKDFEMTVIMPQKFDCTGASTGNICTVRCRNNAQAGPFGGCFPVKQSNKKAQTNNAKTIPTKSNIAAVSAQLAVDQKDFADAVAANQNAGTAEAKKADAAVKAMLAPVSSGSFPTQTVPVELGAAATAPANNNNNGGNNGNFGGNRGGNNGGFGGFGGNRNNKQQKRDILRALRMGN